MAALTPRTVEPAALGDPAFAAGDHLTYPPVEWWQSVEQLVPPPTRAKYWFRFSLDRLTKATPLPGLSRKPANVKRRAQQARRWRQQLQAAEGAGLDSTLEWQIRFRGTLEYSQSGGPELVANVQQTSPWQSLRGIANHDQIQALYYDVCRAVIRGSTGFTSDKDNRHGPGWSDDKAPTISNFLKRFPEGSITYENSNLFPSKVTLHTRRRPTVRGDRGRSWTLYEAGRSKSKARHKGGAAQLGEPHKTKLSL